jgi:WD40 repeat protein
VAYSPDGKRLASASHDKTVRVWDAQTGQELLTLLGHTTSVSDVAFSTDGMHLASAGAGVVIVWDVQTGAQVFTLNSGGGGGHVAVSPDGTRLAGDRKVWDANTGKELVTLEGEGVSVRAFSPDGKRLASSGQRVVGVKVWDAQTGKVLLSRLKGHTGGVNGLAFSPDGKHLASAAYDGTVKVWNSETGEEVVAFVGHVDRVWNVDFSPDGKRLASAGGGVVKVWNAITGQELFTFKGQFGRGVAFSPDGKYIASGGVDNTVKVWRITALPEKR